jgi:hypothetical protein
MRWAQLELEMEEKETSKLLSSSITIYRPWTFVVAKRDMGPSYPC